MYRLGLQQLAKNVTTTLIRQIASGVLQLITLAIIARILGTDGNGFFTIALLLPTMLATFLNLGIGPANVYFLGTGKVLPQQAWNVTLRLSIYISLVGWLVGGVAIGMFAEQWFPGVPATLLWLSLLFFPFIFLSTAIGNIFQGLQEFKYFNALLIVQPIVNLCLIFIIITLCIEDIFYVLLCHFLSLLVTLTFAHHLLKQTFKDNTPIMSNYTKQLLNYGYKAHLSNILAFVNNRVDMFLLGYFIGPTAIGIYAVAVNLTEKLWLFSSAVSTVLLPRLSELSSDESKRNQLTPLIARWTLWVTFFASLMLALLGKWVVDLFFGEQFESAYIVILFLIPGVVLGACSMVIANDMAARGRPELNLATSWISVLINIVGNILLIPKYGIIGTAFTTSFAYIINFAMRLSMHNYFTGVKIHKNFMMGIEDSTLIKTVLKQNKIKK